MSLSLLFSLLSSLTGNSGGTLGSPILSLASGALKIFAFAGFSLVVSIGFVFAAFFFGYRQSWLSFLLRLLRKAIDHICILVKFPDRLEREGLGVYSWLPWISVCFAITFGYIMLSSLGMAFTTIIGLLLIITTIVMAFFQKPGIWLIRNLPKSRFRPDIEEFLSAIASDMGIKHVRFRIDESEGSNVYGYECAHDGEIFRYVVFGGEIARFAQEYDTPEKPDVTARSILAFAVAHELAHIRSGDTKAKHDAIRFLFPLQGINRTFFRAKAAMAGINISRIGGGYPDGRGHMGYNILSGILSFLQLPYYALFALVMLPFHALSHKMERRADEQAFSVLSSSDTVKRCGITPKQAACDFLCYVVESRPRILHPSFFEAAMTVHPAPSDRAKALGIQLSDS